MEPQHDGGVIILIMNPTLPPTGRRSVLLSAAVLVAVLANEAHGTAAAQNGTLSVNDVVGCYELRSIEWTPPLSTLPESRGGSIRPLAFSL
jgi:hypothetical protein